MLSICSHKHFKRIFFCLVNFETISPTASKKLSVHSINFKGFLGGASGKEPSCQCKRSKRLGFDPWVRDGGRHGNPLQYSRLENPHGQRSLAGYSRKGCKEYVSKGRKELDTTKHTNDFNSGQRRHTGAEKQLGISTWGAAATPSRLGERQEHVLTRVGTIQQAPLNGSGSEGGTELHGKYHERQGMSGEKHPGFSLLSISQHSCCASFRLNHSKARQ